MTWLWRPVLAGKLTLTEIKAGIATVEDIAEINALLDMQDAVQAKQMEDNK